MVQCAGCVYTGFTGHVNWLSKTILNVNISRALYIKAEEVNTATYNLEKNYYRVDKKTTS
jgi:hypothetical protein